MTACALVGCRGGVGRWHPVLLIKPLPRYAYTGAPMQMKLGIVICDAHKLGSTAADFISDEGWLQIEQAFSGNGWAEPDRSTVGLDFELFDGN